MAEEIRRETSTMGTPGGPPGAYGSYGGPQSYSGGYGGPAYGTTTAAFERTPMLKRMSWGAIFAGTFVALALSVLLWLLGAAVGFAAFDPATPPGEAAMWGFGIWGIVVAIISLFCGGLVAAWLAGLPKWMDAMLHGVVVWGLTTTAAIAFTALTGATMFAGGMAAVGDQVAMGPSFQQQQIFGIGERREDPSEQVRSDLKDILPTEDDWFGWGRDREYTERDIDLMVRQLQQGQRQQVLSALIRDGELDQQEAQNRIMQWERTLQQAQMRDRTFAAPERDMQRQRMADPQAREAVDAATIAFTWAFFALLLGACAAAVGGAIGRPAYMEDRIITGGHPRYTPPGYQHTERREYRGGEHGGYQPPPSY